MHDFMTETFMSKLDLRFMKYHALLDLCSTEDIYDYIHINEVYDMIFELLSSVEVYTYILKILCL